MGNQSDDLAHPTVDVISPDFPPGSEQERRIRNNCAVVPVEVPGVIGVAANGNRLCLQGTSMASPHVAGVAALVQSVFAGISPGAVRAKVQQTADAMACPDTSIYAPLPQSSGAPQLCEGDTDYNSFNGHGQVNALSAIS